MSKTDLLTRRKVLGIAGASALGLTGISNASARTGVEELHGYAYNPNNHRIIGDASAKITRTKTHIAGVVGVDGKKIPIKSDAKVAKRNESHPVHVFTGRTNDRNPSQVGSRDTHRYQMNISATIGEGVGISIVDVQRDNRFAVALNNKQKKSTVKKSIKAARKKGGIS